MIEQQSVNLLSAVLLGLMGAGHCFAMCGGIISTLSISSSESSNKKNWQFIILYQLGRITSYTFFGGVAGWVGLGVNQLTPVPILKVISGVLLILMALYLTNLWLGLSYLEKVGKLVWDRISPFTKRLLPVKTAKQAFLLGSLWGWLPCGLVYTSLGYALSLGDTLLSATFMLFFGIGTLPATLFAGSASFSLKKLLNHNLVRALSAIVFLTLGAFTIYSVFTSSGMAHHHH